MPPPPSKFRPLAPILLFLGCFFVLLAAQEGCYQRAVKLQATVLSKHYSPGGSRVGSGIPNSASSHSITYRFTAPDGSSREDTGRVLLADWTKLRVGDPVDIEYLSATKDSRVARQTAPAPVFLAIAATLLLGGFKLKHSEHAS